MERIAAGNDDARDGMEELIQRVLTLTSMASSGRDPLNGDPARRINLRGGDAWDAKIRRQIKKCALFAPVISANCSRL